MITLYNATMTRSTRVIWLLEELGADYRIVPVTISRPDGTGAPDPRNPHPLKQVPAVEHDGEIIVESLAVWLHVSDLYPEARLAPPVGHAKRAEYMGWMGIATAVFEPLVAAAMTGAPLNSQENAAREFLDNRFQKALGRHPYLLWAEFSTVDLVYASLLRFYPAALPERPAYRDWLARIAARPAALRVRAKDAER